MGTTIHLSHGNSGSGMKPEAELGFGPEVVTRRTCECHWWFITTVKEGRTKILRVLKSFLVARRCPSGAKSAEGYVRTWTLAPLADRPRCPRRQRCVGQAIVSISVGGLFTKSNNNPATGELTTRCVVEVLGDNRVRCLRVFLWGRIHCKKFPDT